MPAVAAVSPLVSPLRPRLSERQMEIHIARLHDLLVEIGPHLDPVTHADLHARGNALLSECYNQFCRQACTHAPGAL